MGIAAALICYVSVKHLKEWLKYDDALDVFGLHGVGGIVGAILVGVFANPDIGGASGLLYGNGEQVIAQILSVVVTFAYSAVMTFILLVAVRFVFGLRVDPRVEYWGLDLAHHGETIAEYNENLPKDYLEQPVLKKTRAKKSPAKSKKKKS